MPSLTKPGGEAPPTGAALPPWPLPDRAHPEGAGVALPPPSPGRGVIR